MISECAADLLAKVKTVPALAISAALSLGGKSADPGLLKIPLPAAWVMLTKDASDEPSYEHGPDSGVIHAGPVLLATFSVNVFTAYSDDANMLTATYPMLEAIAVAIHATESPSGFRWRYAGQRVALVYPDRLTYEQRYTVNYVLTPTP